MRILDKSRLDGSLEKAFRDRKDDYRRSKLHLFNAEDKEIHMFFVVYG